MKRPQFGSTTCLTREADYRVGRGWVSRLHSQLTQLESLPSSRTETRPFTLVGPRLTYRKTSRKRSGEVTFSLATILGCGGFETTGSLLRPSLTWLP